MIISIYDIYNILYTYFKLCQKVLRGFTEAPYHQSGDDEFDIKNYLGLLYRVWSQPANKDAVF